MSFFDCKSDALASLVLGDLAFLVGGGGDTASSEDDGLGRPVGSSFLTRFFGVDSVDGGARFLDGFGGETSSFLIAGAASSFLTLAAALVACAGLDAAAAALVALAIVFRSM